MDNVSYAEGYTKPKWYSQPLFPLIPLLDVRKPVKPRGEWDSGTSGNFTFSWLFLTVWSLDHPHFELAIVADTHWGIGVTGILPYLRWKFTIPAPAGFASWVHKHLDRRP